MWLVAPVGRQSRRRNLSSAAGAGTVDNDDDCTEPCTVYVGSDHLERRTPRDESCMTRARNVEL